MSHILLIDDDKAIADVMSVVLEDLGYSYSIVNSFEELKKYSISSCDLIFLDGNVGSTSSVEISKYIHKHPVLRKSALVIFSAADNADQISRDTNAQGVLKKPFEIDQLEKMIDAYVQK